MGGGRINNLVLVLEILNYLNVLLAFSYFSFRLSSIFGVAVPIVIGTNL